MKKVSTTTPIGDLTVGELIDLLENGRKSRLLEPRPEVRASFVYGIAGIAELFNCSKPAAGRLKRSGRIDAAITQVGQTIIVDARRALELAGA